MTVEPILATRGAAQVRLKLAEFLAATFPSSLAAARGEWGLTTEELPPLKGVRRYEVQTLEGEKVPLLAIALGRVASYGTTDLVDAHPSYDVRYPVRVFAWLQAEGYETTQCRRDDYAQVLAATILGTPSLGTGGPSGDRSLQLVENTLEVSFSDSTKVKGERWLSGVSVAFDVRHHETLRRVGIGSANSVTVTATVPVDD